MLVASSASAQFYRWIDQAGKVHYTDAPPPPAAAKSVEQKKLGGSVIETSQAPYQLTEAVRMYPVVLCRTPTLRGSPYLRPPTELELAPKLLKLNARSPRLMMTAKTISPVFQFKYHGVRLAW